MFFILLSLTVYVVMMDSDEKHDDKKMMTKQEKTMAVGMLAKYTNKYVKKNDRFMF